MHAEISLHLEQWAPAMAADCDAAGVSIHACAISCMPPRTAAPGAWPSLWASWCAAAARGLAVTLHLPAPLKAHGATHYNGEASRIAAAHGIRPRLKIGPRLLHSKALVIDNRIVWLGSGNFTAAAASKNAESYVRIISPDIAADIVRRLEQLP
jgi:phosphatidylserine/phosphatidylglycerophosphate/cardiolipin synthase-like enzyme